MKVPGNDFEQLVFLLGLELPLSSCSTPGIPLYQQRFDVHPIQLCTALGQVQLIFICRHDQRQQEWIRCHCLKARMRIQLFDQRSAFFFNMLIVDSFEPVMHKLLHVFKTKVHHF